MTPRVLLVTTSRWVATARLAKAMRCVGCDVAVIGPRGHPVTALREAVRVYPYRVFAPLRSIHGVLETERPDLVIPCDDLAVGHLDALSREGGRRGRDRTALPGVRRRRLDDSTPPLTARAPLIRLARQEGIRAPDTEVVDSSNDLARWFAGYGGPAVLKTDGSRGVRIVDTLAEARRALLALMAPPSLARAVKRAVVNGDLDHVRPCVRRTRAVVNAQRFVLGQDANCTVACWEGTVLASVTVRVLRTISPCGPASVVQLTEHRQMAEAAERLVRCLGISGLIGFDFILEAGTGDAHLIEMNPRATQMCHLPLGAGRDLPAALHSVLSGQRVRERPSVTQGDLVALFPQEWLRDPTSEFLTTACHDVPWDEPDLIRACLRETLPYRAYLRLSTMGRSTRSRRLDDELRSMGAPTGAQTNE